MVYRLLSISILILAVAISSYAQKLSISSFELLENDLEALSNPVSDPSSGKKAALLKIVTTQSGFQFEPDQLGIVQGPIYKTAEIWIYLPVGARMMNISHPQLGLLRGYVYPIPIEAQKVYEMNIEIPLQDLLISVKPQDAIISINNGLFQTFGKFDKKLKPGKYNYKVEAPMYYSDSGVIDLTIDKQVNKIINLKPNFGFAIITTIPKDGAIITIDDYEDPLSAPYKTDKLKPGSHTAKVSMDKYKKKVQTFAIDTGKITNVNVVLQRKDELTIPRIAMWSFIGVSGYLFYNSYIQNSEANNAYEKYKSATTDATNWHKKTVEYDRNALIYAASGIITSTCAYLLKKKVNRIKFLACTNSDQSSLLLTYNF
jgi:hypothetical protein